MTENRIEMPDGLEYQTADEVAECVEYQKYLPPEYGHWEKLYGKLWSFLDDSSNPTPMGGDGSNGTVEEPSGRLSLDNDDKTGHWWDKLEPVEQRAIAAAWEAS